ncbi:hypothetical protein [Vreelandella titanicae]|uniref:hypothetical protein n=1 Tax=Vreelandella titanicae TaxID=664683 RepID=UPI0038005F6B
MKPIYDGVEVRCVFQTEEDSLMGMFAGSQPIVASYRTSWPLTAPQVAEIESRTMKVIEDQHGTSPKLTLVSATPILTAS